MAPRPEPPRCWWVIALVSLVVLTATGIGAWALFGGDAPRAGGARISARGLSYRVPSTWTTQPQTDRPWVGDMRAEGVGTGPRFSCGAHQHTRATTGVLLVYRNDGRPARAQDAAKALGESYAKTAYGDDAQLSAGPVAPWRDTGVTTSVTARSSAEGGCQVSGQVHVIALPSPEQGPGGQPTVRVFLLQDDTSGGPRSPGRLSPRETQEILASLQVSDR